MAAPSDRTGRSWRELLRPVWRMVEFDGGEVFILLIYTLALGVVSAAVPFASQVLVNQAAFTGAAPPIVALATIVLGVLLIGAFIRLFQIRVAALIAKRAFVRSALRGTESLLDHPSRAYEFDDREVANRFFDVMTFQVAFGVLASEGLGVVVLSIVGIIILALYHPMFFAFSCAVMLLCIIVIGLAAKRGLARSSPDRARSTGSRTGSRRWPRTALCSGRRRPTGSFRNAPTSFRRLTCAAISTI